MSYMDANYHDAHNLIYALQNPVPSIPLIKPGNGNKEAFINLAEIIRKENPPAVPPRVPSRELYQKKLQEMNQEGTQMKSAPQ